MAKKNKNNKPKSTQKVGQLGSIDYRDQLSKIVVGPPEVAINDFTTSFDPAYRSTTSTKNNAPFINPYIFLPIPEVEPERGKVIKGPLSGVIKCTLEINTPTFIPNTSKGFSMDVPSGNRTVKHISYEFYSYDDLSSVPNHPSKPPVNPIIPGSELRGMIRNVYEQLTNSCFLVVDENNLPYKRTPQPKIPAILRYEDDNWYLYKNPSFFNIPLLKVDSNVPCTVRLEGEGLERKAIADEDGTHVLHITGEIGTKLSHIVFDPNSGTDKVKLDKDSDILERFENVIKSYCDDKVNLGKFVYRYREYQRRYEAKKTLFVYMDETGTYLSPSQLTKEYFVSKIPDILHTQNKHDKCTDFEHVCPACQLFGMIGDDGAVRGRVRFTDARAKDKDSLKWLDWYTMPILSSPRISATEFYLLPPYYSQSGGSYKQAAMWNYDYYYPHYDLEYNGSEYIKIPYDAMIPGRKVYWLGEFDNNNSQKSNMNNTVRPLAGGIFEFEIFYDDLSDIELEDLLFSLTLNNIGQHRIGRGKPIGMGSVSLKVAINNVKLKTYTYNSVSGVVTTNKHRQIVGITQKTDAANMILRYATPLAKTEQSLVQYPTMKKQNSRIYEWFGRNRGTVLKPEINQTLPLLTDPDKTLEKY